MIAAKIFYKGPSLAASKPSDREISVPAETASSRDFQEAVAAGDYAAAAEITRAHVAAHLPPGTSIPAKAHGPIPDVTIRPAMGSCMAPYLGEGELILETAEPAKPHCLASYRLVDEPETFGRVKVFLGASPVPPTLRIEEYGDQQPKKMFWFYQTNPLVIYGISNADIDRVRYCQRLQGQIEEPFPLNEEHRLGIAAAMAS